MANCIDCNVKLNFLNRRADGRCSECSIARATADYEEKISKLESDLRAEKLALQLKDDAIDAILLTTETATNLNIIDRKKVIVAAVESALDAKIVEKHEELVRALKAEAHSVGGNAVVGVTFNVVETYAATIGVGELKRFKMVAFGTAVEVSCT
jgi:uncharacterized protein YbjQ (UPF0145 family)